MNFFKGFYYAGRGIVAACRGRNFRFHLCAMAFVIFFAARFYSFSAERWVLLLLTCCAVLVSEAVNTAIEKLSDKVSPEKDPLIRSAKDLAAGAVLISAIFAAVIGIILFWNKDVFYLIGLYFSEPSRLAALGLALVAAWGIVFVPKEK